MTSLLILFWAAPVFALDFVTLDVPGAKYTIAGGIYGKKVVGSYADAQDVYHGFLYDGATWTTIDEPNAAPIGNGGTYPTGIYGNVVVGYYYDGLLYPHGFRYDGSAYTELNYPGSSYTNISGIYANKLVGTYADSSGKGHGFLYDGSTWKTIDDPAGTYGTFPFGLNSDTIVGGYATVSFGPSQAFEYNISTDTFTNIPGENATGIEGSRIVGFNEDFVINEGALIGVTYDLGDQSNITDVRVPGAYDTNIIGISNGRIVGTYSVNGVNHGYIAVLVPEPSGFCIASVGVALMLSARQQPRRRVRRAPHNHPSQIASSRF